MIRLANVLVSFYVRQKYEVSTAQRQNICPSGFWLAPNTTERFAELVFGAEEEGGDLRPQDNNTRVGLPPSLVAVGH